MNDLEDAVRFALRTLPEPDMQLPVGFPDELRRKYQRRRRYAPMAVAGLAGAAACTAVLWPSLADSSAPVVPAVSSAPAAPSPAPALIPSQQVSDAALPAWAASSPDDLTVWLGSPHAFTVAGSPVFVVGESVPGGVERNDPTMSQKPEAEVEFQRTEAQVDGTRPAGRLPRVSFSLAPGSSMSPNEAAQRLAVINAARAAAASAAAAAGQSNPSYGCGTGSAGTESTFALTAPALLQLRCWPTLQENVWVWSRLPAGVASIAYVLDDHVVARSTTLDGIGAIRLPRPVSATADQGQLEAISASGHVLLRAKLPWMQ